jgi:YbbR domain-containing protein
LLDRLTNNWSLKLLALAIALALWVFVVGQEKSEISVRVPVEITNIPPDTLVVDDVVGEVDARLYGPRTLIRRVAAERLSKAVDLTGLKVGAHVFQIEPEDLKLPPGVRVLRISPDSFRLTLVPRLAREVPVQPVLRGKPAQGFEQAEVGLRPSRVTVVGPRDEIAELDWVFTVPVDLSERKETFSQTVPLRPPRERNARLGRGEVEVTVAVRPVPVPAPKPEGLGEDKRDGKRDGKGEAQGAKPARKKPRKPKLPQQTTQTPQSPRTSPTPQSN